MLTIKQITEDTDKAIRALEKKHFKHAKETIAEVIRLNDKRKAAQAQLDSNLAEINATSKNIGRLMKEGKKEEAEAAKQRVALIKETNKDARRGQGRRIQANARPALHTIPNLPYDEVPEGEQRPTTSSSRPEDWETELPKNALPHWELAKKYDLIDFDLGVKITGAGFPVYKGKGARLQRALINFFLEEAQAAGYTEIVPPDRRQLRIRIRHRTTTRQGRTDVPLRAGRPLPHTDCRSARHQHLPRRHTPTKKNSP